MSRISLLAVVAACTAAHSEPPRIPAGLDAWLDTWGEARRCLVAEAQDTTTGISMAMLLGNDCSRPLHQLHLPAPRDGEVGQLWTFAAGLADKIEQQPSPSLRAQLIGEIDARVLVLGLHAGRTPTVSYAKTPLRLLSPFQLPSSEGDEGDWTWLQNAMQSSDRYQALAGGATAQRGVVVRKPLWPAAEHGYELVITSDHGAHWQTRIEAPRSHVVDHWQDELTGVIELLMESDRGAYSVHRIAAKDPTPIIRAAHDGFRERGHTAEVLRCNHDGLQWTVDGDVVSRFGGNAMQLAGTARGGQLACRHNTAIVLRRNPDVVERCDERCVVEWSAPAHLQGAVALLRDGRWIYAASLERVVAVWSESDSTPRFFHLPSPGKIEAIEMHGAFPVLVIFNGTNTERIGLQ